MSFYFFYFFASIPIIIGAVLWYKNQNIIWQEWVGGCAAALILAGIFHLSVYYSQGSDVETWSGQIIKAVHYPEWIEEYQQMHTRTVDDGDGKSHTETYWTTEYRTHHEYWAANSNIDTEYKISREKFEEMKSNFQNYIIEQPYKSGFDSGDRNIYVSYNKSGYIYPITDLRSWTNKVRACPSVFSYPKVSDKIPVYEHPENPDPWQSNRLLGTAQRSIDILEFDRMNARLGPTKFVNVIIVGFNSTDSSLGQWQEAKWIGGSKNDVVICFGSNNDKPDWVYVFGWTENKICLRNLETIIRENGVNNEVLSLVEGEIRQNYKLKDWSKFDYLSIEPPMWSVIVYIIVLILSQGGLYWYFHNNEFTKNFRSYYNRYSSYSFRRRY